MQVGISQVGAGKLLAEIGTAIGRVASGRGYTLIRNLASNGVERSLQECPGEIAIWPDRRESRRMTQGLNSKIAHLMSRGGIMATYGEDEWRLYSEPSAPVVQYTRTVIATRSGAMMFTLPA